ncbi:hypothetical protein [Thalassotalea sp. PP2-459]|uniref:hypothetical protein n=1 Tax=Thalassotalea sp. PP2-459 TaxID=1742724 RepID=UPI00094428EC|nr:hypothetical protein [Thalassotalea sp. PP2-459]OKY27181.1 hypothetical protein BI291_09640 [Thalassotalea sp. PP2-459]
MFRYICNKMLLAMKNRYNYDVSYMQSILHTDFAAFIKFMCFQTMSSHKGTLANELLYAARIRTILWDDCGSCTQLMVNMALEAEIPTSTIEAIIINDLTSLSEETALIVQYTEKVLTHDPTADELREKIIMLLGNKALIAIAYAISSTRVYPTLKYSLGYGKACQQIKINSKSLIPNSTLQTIEE